MEKTQNTINVLLFSLAILFLYSCDSQDVCVDEGNSPKLNIQMYYLNSNTELFDTITFWRYGKNDIIINKPTTLSNVSSFSLPVIDTINKRIKYLVQIGTKDYFRKQELNGQLVIKDTVKVKYDTIILNYGGIADQYTSTACGFGIYFKDITIKTSNNWIPNTETKTNDIKDSKTINFVIYANSRY